ncbi:MAG: hypothetical protein B7C55_02560 [Actinomycetales bacterium mxb001]|nr:MAG: hypothetical protein B7C55_02560 [Actinomycetales bacterium mxb001]
MPPAFVAQARDRLSAFLVARPRGQSAADLLQRIIQAQSVERIGLTAAGIAFWFVIALFPALIAVVMVLGLVLSPTEIANTLEQLDKASPNSLGGVVLRQVEAAASSRPSALSLGFAVSLVIVLWSTSAGYYNFARGTRMAYGLPPQNYVRARGRAFVGATAGMLITAVLAVGTALLVSYAGSQSGAWRVLLLVANATVGIGLLALALAALFRFSTGRLPQRTEYLPGAAFGAIGTVAVFIGFGIFVSYAGSYDAVYGALSSAIILMLTVYFAAYAVLIGAVLNAQLRRVGT